MNCSAAAVRSKVAILLPLSFHLLAFVGTIVSLCVCVCVCVCVCYFAGYILASVFVHSLRVFCLSSSWCHRLVFGL